MNTFRKILLIVLIILSVALMGVITYVGFFLPTGHYFLIRTMTVIVDLYILDSIIHAVKHDD